MKPGVSLQSACLGRYMARGEVHGTGERVTCKQKHRLKKGGSCCFKKNHTSLINATFCLALMKQVNKAIGAHMAMGISLD